LKGKIYLIPVPLGGYDFRDVIPENVINTTIKIRHFIVENEKSARRYLKLIDKEFPLDESVFMVLDEHTSEKNIPVFLDYVVKGIDTGLMSEAGIPGIADPGANLVKLAHSMDIRVVPLSGPSSIILALSASGLNGQNFTFHGYLPVKKDALIPKMHEIEKRSVKGETQIFMEAPYRNQRMLEYLISVCNPDTKLCIAADITLASEEITTRTISEWKNKLPQLKNRLVIFLLNAGY